MGKCLYAVKQGQTLVHPREVYADALTDRTAALVVAHNHPSGKVEPSPEDREVTKRLMMAGDTPRGVTSRLRYLLNECVLQLVGAWRGVR